MLLGLVHSTSTHTELFIEFHNTSLTWATPTSQPPQPFGDLSHWFSFTLDENGQLSEVHHPPGELDEVLAFKKTVVKILGAGDVERTIEGSKVILREAIQENGLSGTKVITLGKSIIKYHPFPCI